MRARTYTDGVEHEHDGCVDRPEPSARGALARDSRLLEQNAVPAHDGEADECLADHGGDIVENELQETERQRHCEDVVLGAAAIVVVRSRARENQAAYSDWPERRDPKPRVKVAVWVEAFRRRNVQHLEAEQ